MSTDLERARDHARRMADLALSPADAALWRQLADEIDAYLAPCDDVPLFEGE